MMDAYLLLADGTKFTGRGCGAGGIAIGEVVFCTGMTGYQEVLTDPSFYGQIVGMTYLCREITASTVSTWNQGKPGPRVSLRAMAKEPSNFRQDRSLQAFLKAQNIIGLEGDRHLPVLTRLLRENGVMNGAICHGVEADEGALLAEIRSYRITDAVLSVTVGAQECHRPENPRFRVGLFDYGFKESIRRSLLKRGCEVTVLPAHTTAREAKALGFDGLMLSGGPGDPADNDFVIAEAKQLFLSGTPIFAICLGHQILSLATGAKREKLKYGHHGANHPVKDLATGRSYITSQNHGYAILADSIPENLAALSHINLNDQSVEGIRYRDYPVFTVQFHPRGLAGATGHRRSLRRIHPVDGGGAPCLKDRILRRFSFSVPARSSSDRRRNSIMPVCNVAGPCGKRALKSFSSIQTPPPS